MQLITILKYVHLIVLRPKVVYYKILIAWGIFGWQVCE